MEMSTGIRRRNVSSRSVSGFVVAPISIKREVRGVLSPTRRNTPVSSREKKHLLPGRRQAVDLVEEQNAAVRLLHKTRLILERARERAPFYSRTGGTAAAADCPHIPRS